MNKHPFVCFCAVLRSGINSNGSAIKASLKREISLHPLILDEGLRQEMCVGFYGTLANPSV